MAKSEHQTKSILRMLAITTWVLISGAYLTFFILDLDLDYAQLLTPCSGENCNYLAVSQAEFDALENWGLPSRLYSLILNGATVIGVAASWLLAVLILLRQGNTRIGWTVSLTLAIIPITMISDVDNVGAHYPNLHQPIAILSGIGMIILLGFFYLFPSGQFYPRWAYIPYALSIFVFEFFGRFTQGIQSSFRMKPLLPLLLITTVFLPGIFQIFRYRRVSDPKERQQTKWLLFGLLLIIANFPIWFLFFGGTVEIPPGQLRLLASLGGWLTNMLFTTTLPVTMSIAILRYRLWDIDLVIRRTLVYSTLTILLALVYFGSITLLQSLLSAITGQQSTAAIVMSTLGIAALFNPLRYRIQDAIDRRFYRRKYDSEQALGKFAAVARNEVDLARLNEALIQISHETLQPETVSLSLTDRSRTRQ